MEIVIPISTQSRHSVRFGKMKFLLLVLWFGFMPFGLSAEPANSAPSPSGQYSESDLQAFKAFLQQPRALAAKDIEDRFGPPPRYAPLLLNEGPHDATRDHSWWYYSLGKDRKVGVRVDAGKVKGAFYFFPRETGGVQTEILRMNEI